MPDAARNHAPAAGARNLILIDARLSSRSPRYSHVGLDPGLIDEHQAVRVQPAFQGLPPRPLAGDRVAGLLKGEQSFF